MPEWRAASLGPYVNPCAVRCRTFDVNALAVVWTTKAFLPAMLDRNSGHIVTVSSLGECRGLAGRVVRVAVLTARHSLDARVVALQRRSSGPQRWCPTLVASLRRGASWMRCIKS